MVPQEAPPVKAPTPLLEGHLLLALFQKQGRLIDFLKQDIGAYSHEQIGEAARVVHEGCAEVLNTYLTIQPIRSEGEGESIVIEAGFDPAWIRLSGNVQGAPPFSGELIHHGWQLTGVQMPQSIQGTSPNILAPVEVEVR